MTLDEYFSEEPRGSKTEMAKFLGISLTYMSLLINRRRRPSKLMAEKIQSATQGLCTVSELMGIQIEKVVKKPQDIVLQEPELVV